MAKIIFFGTPLFAVPTLGKLIKSHHHVVVVVTQPDRPKGRHLKVTPPPIKVLAQANRIKVLQPQDSKEPSFLRELKDIHAELGIVVSYGEMLSNALLQIPRLYCLNVHPSLLPKYRGASPIATAILNREPETGITIIKISERLDAGDILIQRSTPISSGEDALALSEKLSQMGAELTLEAIELIESGKAVFKPQDESKATYARQLKKENGKIDWSHSAEEIEASVRAFAGWPEAYTFYQGKGLGVCRAKIIEHAAYGRCGQVLRIAESEGMEISTGEKVLLIQEVQPQNRRRMKAAEFVRGYRLRPGDVLG